MCHVLSFLCVDQPVITLFSLSDIDSSAPDSARERLSTEYFSIQNVNAFATVATHESYTRFVHFSLSTSVESCTLVAVGFNQHFFLYVWDRWLHLIEL